MGNFILNTSILQGGQYRTVATQFVGDFREIQLHFFQPVVNQDMEVHWIEFHFTPTGTTDEAL